MLYTVALLVLVMILMERKHDFLVRFGENLPGSGIARIRCVNRSGRNFTFTNIIDCNAVYDRFGSASRCKSGCIGLGSCIRECPVGAITVDFEVVPKKCTGCGRCVEICPVGIIKILDSSKRVYVACFAAAPAKENGTEICSAGCSRCYICIDICLKGAISVGEKGLPEIDYSKCDDCGKCVSKCPAGVLRQHILTI